MSAKQMTQEQKELLQYKLSTWFHDDETTTPQAREIFELAQTLSLDEDFLEDLERSLDFEEDTDKYVHTVNPAQPIFDIFKEVFMPDQE